MTSLRRPRLGKGSYSYTRRRVYSFFLLFVHQCHGVSQPEEVPPFCWICAIRLSPTPKWRFNELLCSWLGGDEFCCLSTKCIEQRLWETIRGERDLKSFPTRVTGCDSLCSWRPSFSGPWEPHLHPRIPPGSHLQLTPAQLTDSNQTEAHTQCQGWEHTFLPSNAALLALTAHLPSQGEPSPPTVGRASPRAVKLTLKSL